MIFSSNQVFAISGDLYIRNGIEDALSFALKYSDIDKNMTKQKVDKEIKFLYQITKDGKFCIGWSYVNVPEGWKEFPFEFSVESVSKLIREHLEEYPIIEDIWDGSYRKGFLMKCIEETLSDEFRGIRMPFYTIVYFEPFTCFYSK